MKKQKPLTPYEEAMKNIDRIIAELDKEARKCTRQEATQTM